jgi:hypothetical protein
MDGLAILTKLRDCWKRCEWIRDGGGLILMLGASGSVRIERQVLILRDSSGTRVGKFEPRFSEPGAAELAELYCELTAFLDNRATESLEQLMREINAL